MMATGVISSARLFPEPRLAGPTRHTPLSVLDATVARFSPTGAVWLYDSLAPSEPAPAAGSRTGTALSVDQLTRSLQKTISDGGYAQWTGRLQWEPYRAEGDHTQRFGRLSLVYGAEDDPGVELVVAHCPRALSSLVPSAAERAAGSDGCWDADQLPSADLLPATPLALAHDADDQADLPCVQVQLTTFECGGVAIGVKLPHPLADAQTLLQFVHDWAAVNRAMAGDAPLPKLSPVFDPQLLDRLAAGDIDAITPDAELVHTARGLPIHRYDWWASAEGCPAFIAQATQIPSVLDPASVGPPGNPMPWSEWDMTAPVAHVVLCFGADEVHGMWQEATSAIAASSQSSVTQRISHLDALLSHVWALIIRARGLDGDETAYLDVTLGLRGRVSPPLPDSFLGSPIVLAYATATGDLAASAHSLGTMAASIRATLGKFDSTTVPALLHDIAHEAGAQRLWNAFLGRRHTIVTSWLRLNAYGVEFAAAASPRYVEAVMPSVDGCLQVMEAGLGDGDMSVSLHLRADVMQKLLKDPILRRFVR